MERRTWKIKPLEHVKTKTGYPLSYRSPAGSYLSGFLSLMEMPHFIDLEITM